MCEFPFRLEYKRYPQGESRIDIEQYILLIAESENKTSDKF